VPPPLPPIASRAPVAIPRHVKRFAVQAFQFTPAAANAGRYLGSRRSGGASRLSTGRCHCGERFLNDVYSFPWLARPTNPSSVTTST